MTYAFRITLAGAGLLSLAACGPTVRSERDEAIPVPQGATWSWEAAAAAPRDTGVRAPYGRDAVGAIAEQRFQRALESAMQAKGFRQVADTAQAEFLLGYRIGTGRSHGDARAVHGVVGLGFYGGWGYRPWGFGRFGFYRPWGFYSPWAWGWYGAPVWAVAPLTPVGYRSYEDATLVVVLRQRATGYVAWTGRLTPDEYGARRLSQEQAQKIANRLLKDLP